MNAPAGFIGMCPECLSCKQFPTARERDQWEQHHPHDSEVGNV